jgi:hypothetical protein
MPVQRGAVSAAAQLMMTVAAAASLPDRGDLQVEAPGREAGYGKAGSGAGAADPAVGRCREQQARALPCLTDPVSRFRP